MELRHESKQADIERWAAAYPGSAGDAYMKRRGIPTETAERFNIGYNETERRVTIPTATGYNARAIDDGREPKYKGNIGEKGIFPANWAEMITHNEPEPALFPPEAVFIVEGEINALSIMEATGYTPGGVVGYGAIAMGGTGGTKKLANGIVDTMNNGAKLRPFILIPDIDAPKEGEADGVGIKAMRELAQRLTEAGVDYCFFGDAGAQGRFDVLNDAADANDALTADRRNFAKALIDAAGDAPGEIKRKRDAARTAYLARAAGSSASMANFDKYLADKANRPHISTGIEPLDELLDGGLDGRLYIVAAASSYGKTSFCLQMAEHISAAGTDVLFFAFEMGREELIAKGISRRTYLNAHHTTPDGQINFYKSDAATLQMVLDSVKNPLDKYAAASIATARAEYQRDAANLYMIEVGVGTAADNQRATADFIGAEIDRHIRETEHLPVVIIDYLQLIQPVDERVTAKQNMDATSTLLRQIVRHYKIPVIAISSISRGMYYKPIEKESLKESGDIEFTADVIIGIQARGLLLKSALSNSRDEEKGGKEAYGKTTDDDKNTSEIVVSKNRGGRTSGLKYTPVDDVTTNVETRNVINILFNKTYHHFEADMDADADQKTTRRKKKPKDSAEE